MLFSGIALPQDLPRETIVHDISDEDKKCECGHHLSKIGEEITEQLKYIPTQLSVIQHVRPKYACRPCQENVKIAPMPILYSLIETCKPSNVEPYKYFCAMLHCIRLCKSENDYQKLLPQFIEF